MELTNNPDTNINLVCTEAQLVYPESIIMADLCLAQAILESRLVGVPSSLAKDYNNLFGITDKDGTHNPPRINMPSFEYINGVRMPQNRYFSWNNTLEDSCKQHRTVMELNRYMSVWNSKTFEDAANQVRLCGYATDPKYSQSLIDIYNNYIK